MTTAETNHEGPLASPDQLPASAGMLSFVVPITDNEGALISAYETLRKQFGPSDSTWELLVVGHGASEWTWVRIQRLRIQDPDHVRAFNITPVQDLSAALALGYEEARGELVFTLELDQADDPQEVPTFLEKIDWHPEAAAATAEPAPSRNILPRGILRRERRAIAAA